MSSNLHDKVFLGLDFSTQQIKLIATNEQLQVIYEDAVKFDVDLAEFRTQSGAHIHNDQLTVTAPTLMWVKALDMLFDKMKVNKFNFSSVISISGCGQQHGSVYWKTGARSTLQSLQPDKAMHVQLKDCFSVTESPIWMDSSTTKQCRRLEELVGGAEVVSLITGSRAYERFTGNQISKICEEHPEHYANTERISLVSSFAASLFLGDYASIDASDGSGMNLLDVRRRVWSQECLNACAPDLAGKLGEVVPSHKCLGTISSYLVDRYNFQPDCKIIAFTGDNPASVAGMRLQEGDIVVSLGTSDTVFGWVTEYKPSLQGHVFANPVDETVYMSMLCFKNGALTRDRIKESCASGSWQRFEELLKATSIGNNGNIGIYFDVTEITPHTVGVYRMNSQAEKVSAFPNDVEVRAVIESQFLAKRLYAEQHGYNITKSSRVLATGGTSSSLAILQVLADVFNSSVCVQNVANSASLGCAYRAKHGWLSQKCFVPFGDVVAHIEDFMVVAEPSHDAARIYDPMVQRYHEFERRIVKDSL